MHFGFMQRRHIPETVATQRFMNICLCTAMRFYACRGVQRFFGFCRKRELHVEGQWKHSHWYKCLDARKAWLIGAEARKSLEVFLEESAKRASTVLA
jgi:hypothetical protein